MLFFQVKEVSGKPIVLAMSKTNGSTQVIVPQVTMTKTNCSTELITEPSICIPRTLNNITWRTVKDTFETILGKGTVERVDLINDRNGEPFCKIFIHLRYWPHDEDATLIRQQLLEGETVKIVYDNPWFWKCSASRLPKPQRNTYLDKTPFFVTTQTTKVRSGEDEEGRSPSPEPVRRNTLGQSNVTTPSDEVQDI